MKFLAHVLIYALAVPMMLLMGIAYLLGTCIHWINDEWLTE